MGRTWLTRGVVAAVVVLLLGAWSVEVFGLRGSDDAPPADRDAPATPERTEAPDSEPVVDESRDRAPKVRRTTRPQQRVTPRADREQRGTPASPSATPSSPSSPSSPPAPPPQTPPTDSPDPSMDGPGPTKSPSPPPNTPQDPPSDECTDLLGVLDCVLNPITSGP